MAVDGMRRDDTARPLSIVRAAFRLPTGGNTPSVTGVETGSGGYALVELNAVIPGDPEAAGDEARLREALARVQVTRTKTGSSVLR